MQGNEQEVKELVEGYNAKHGNAVRKILGETWEQIKREKDGDSLAFFHAQLKTMQELVEAYTKGLSFEAPPDNQTKH